MPKYIEIDNLKYPEAEIFTLREPELKNYYAPKGGVFIAESPEVIRLALAAGYQPISLLCESGEESKLPSLPENTPVYVAKREVLKDLVGYNLVRGALCAMKRPTPLSPSSLLQNATRIAVLDHVNNPTNVGAIIRSAAALGMEGVLVSEDSSDPLYRRAIRVSMGTVFKIPWCYAPKNYIDVLKEAGFTTVALALNDHSVSIDDPVLEQQEKIALFLGSEGYGLDEVVVKQCDFTAKIPMYYGVDSLNVAAASAVAFWQLRKPK